MTLPWVIPADMAYATGLKVFETAPKLKYNLKILSEAVIQLLAQALTKWSLSPTAYTAKLTCQLAITEYNDGESHFENGLSNSVFKVLFYHIFLILTRDYNSRTVQSSLITNLCRTNFDVYLNFISDVEAPVEKCLQRKPSIRNKMNFGFTLNIDNRYVVCK